MSKKRIAIVVKNLNDGGAERSASNLSIMLHKLGHEVCFIALEERVNFDYKGEYYPLKGENKIQQFLSFKKLVKNNQFSFIIDFRGKTSFTRELLIYTFIYRNLKKLIFTVHESKIDNYLPKPNIIFRYVLKRIFKIVTVSNGIQFKLNKHYNFNNVQTIFNAIDVKSIESKKEENLSFDYKVSDDYIIAIGRLTKVKQFLELIDVYIQSELPQQNTKLIIIGDGELKRSIELKIKQEHSEDLIIVLPFQTNPYKYLSKAKFLVLCSQREGFPYVLLEALACECPVISFNCSTGPNEIIKHEYNGIMVEDQNFNALKRQMNRLLVDDKLYNTCKSNSKKSVQKFDIEIIAKSWEKLLNSE